MKHLSKISIIMLFFFLGNATVFSQKKKSIQLAKKGDTVFYNQTNYKKRELINNPKPLIIVNGKEIPRKQLIKIKPTKIKSVNVLKGEKAIKKYGEKGRFGVVEIYLKKNEEKRF